MSDKFPLQPLLDIATTRMDDAARTLGELIASERSAQQKLDMLEQYRAEYKERFVEATSAGITLDAMRNFSNFIHRIDEAIEVQHKAVEESRQSTAQGQKMWMNQRNKVRALDTLAVRHQSEIARQANKMEQRMTDEHAARKFRDNNEEQT